MPRDDEHQRKRDRTRSPREHAGSSRRRDRSRSRSKNRLEKRHKSHREHRTDRSDRHQRPTVPQEPPKPVILPYRAMPLSKHDLEHYKNLFASYLDIQKQIDIYALDESEVRGRWKSFVKKWNGKELAEGWYEPSTKTRADEAAAAAETWLDDNIAIEQTGISQPDASMSRDPNDSDDGYGPAPASGPSSGPRPATYADLADRDERAAQDQQLAVADLRAQRKADRQEQKERLDELVPKAESGTRERQLEKRREAAASSKAYREAAEGAGMADVGEADLMGGGGGLDDMKTRKKFEERKKSERELRRLEHLRARQQEREERMTNLRDKEAKTMDMLQALARERFGS